MNENLELIIMLEDKNKAVDLIKYLMDFKPDEKMWIRTEPQNLIIDLMRQVNGGNE